MKKPIDLFSCLCIAIVILMLLMCFSCAKQTNPAKLRWVSTDDLPVVQRRFLFGGLGDTVETLKVGTLSKQAYDSLIKSLYGGLDTIDINAKKMKN